MYDTGGGQTQRLRDCVYINSERAGEIHISSTKDCFFLPHLLKTPSDSV